jgi:hypothetical protein
MATGNCSFAAAVRTGLPSAVILIFTFAVGWQSSIGRGEEPQPALPRDGAWVLYQWDWNRLDNGQKMSATVTLSFVGTIIEKDERCRWIELKYVIPEGNEKGTLIEKMLVRERDLLESPNPMENVLRTWISFNDDPVRLKEFPETNDIAIGPMLLWAPGVLKNAAATNARKDIEYQRGRLKAARTWAGKMTLPETDQGGNVVLRRLRQFTVWTHNELALGFAEAEVRDEVYNVDMTVLRSQQVAVYLLQDAGKDARTALPDKN